MMKIKIKHLNIIIAIGIIVILLIWYYIPVKIRKTGQVYDVINGASHNITLDLTVCKKLFNYNKFTGTVIIDENTYSVVDSNSMGNAVNRIIQKFKYNNYIFSDNLVNDSQVLMCLEENMNYILDSSKWFYIRRINRHGMGIFLESDTEVNLLLVGPVDFLEDARSYYEALSKEKINWK